MPEKDISQYPEDIWESGNAILDYVKDMDFEQFKGDRKTYMAVIREFEIIGEAVARIPRDVKMHYRNIPWRDIKDFRNVLIHEYFGVDLEIVWKVIHKELKELLVVVHQILETHRGEKF